MNREFIRSGQFKAVRSKWRETKKDMDHPAQDSKGKSEGDRGRGSADLGVKAYACSAVACKRRPSALMTLSTVANSGLPSGDSAL